jgi:(1->4)-alpha-D-glucan 1-alpha-D-glucosylmutase
VQTVLKLTIPGVPDIYQGTDLWDLSLVDPDNRRPVDYERRQASLEQVTRALEEDRAGAMRGFFDNWPDGRFKLAAIHTLLDDRRRRLDLYRQGSYESLAAKGPDSDRICSFLRRDGDDALLVVASRFPGRGRKVDASLLLPDSAPQRPCRDLLTGRSVSFRDGEVALGDLLDGLPVAVLAPGD